ncbi:MAG: RNA 2'-phosphotransferase [Thermoprotei archaeon]|nr:MAG: RNA 2'-phosphotransferase [Thermoprotei archaeon]
MALELKDVYKCKICGAYTENEVHCGVKAMLLMNSKQRVKLSKLISGILRHFPESFDLHLDREGFVRIRELVKAIKRYRRSYSWLANEHIVALAYLDPKGRFEIVNNKIRARYGHSINAEVNYEEDKSVKILYHGTTEERARIILKNGIKPMKRKRVHLTSSLEEAWQNAKRWRGKPVILVVNADALRQRGIKVLKAGKYVYVVKQVPPQCIINVIWNEI